MADVTVKRIDELESYADRFFYAGKGIGATAFGMNVLRLPAGWPDHPDHDHAEEGEEEVYVVLEGTATLMAGDETWELEQGMLARVGPEQKRKIVPGDRGATLLAIGGRPGQVTHRG
jgi:mannose-6-phosphate isomerase-like protein (cupin superfamily)